MFNTYYSTDREYIPYEKTVNINEHRAPTDKSIKLFKEFEKRLDKLNIHIQNELSLYKQYNYFQNE